MPFPAFQKIAFRGKDIDRAVEWEYNRVRSHSVLAYKPLWKIAIKHV